MEARADPDVAVLARTERQITAMSGVVRQPPRKPILDMFILGKILSGGKKFEPEAYHLDVGFSQMVVWPSEHKGYEQYSEFVQVDRDGTPIGIRMVCGISMDPGTRRPKGPTKLRDMPVKKGARVKPDLSGLEIFRRRGRIDPASPVF